MSVFTINSPIEDMLPHRYPFLLVDRILEVSPPDSLIAVKNVTKNEPVFQGHFPGHPIYPGVYIIEGMAQASVLLSVLVLQKKTDFLLVQIDNARFKKQVVPGDTLQYEIRFVKKKSSFFWFSGTVKVDSQIVASADFSAYMS